jgi:hypothetical protein
MPLRHRVALWVAAGSLALIVDVLSKAAPHSTVVDNYAQTPAIMLIVVGLFLCALSLVRSSLIALGAGIMFGALCGNGGQLLIQGYVSDWLPIGGWLTNLADLLGGAGLVVCCGGYLRSLTALHD